MEGVWVLLSAVTAGLLMQGLRRKWLLGAPAPALWRLWGAGTAMGLAVLGAAWLMKGGGLEAGLLAGLGCVLALLLVLAADRVWMARGVVGVSSAVGVLLGLLALAFHNPVGWVLPLVSLTAVVGVWVLGDAVSVQRVQGLVQYLQPWMVWLGLALLVRIPVPLWPQGFALVATVQMVLITLAALSWGYSRIGWRIGGLAVLAFGLGLAVELLGSRSGFPFGAYTYAGAPAPTVFSVPLLVPLGWFAMVLSAHVLAGGRPLLTGLLVVAWDVGLEALMPARGFWTWQDPGPLWYGAPLPNFLAWFGVGALLSALFGWLAPRLAQDRSFGWAYRLEAWFVPLGLALFGRWDAALLCGLGMNLLAWWPAQTSFRRASL